MTPSLTATEVAVARDVTARTVAHGGSHVAYGRADNGYRVAAVCVELDRHPSGMRRVAPPAVCSFHAEQWIRIMVMVQQMRKAS